MMSPERCQTRGAAYASARAAAAARGDFGDLGHVPARLRKAPDASAGAEAQREVNAGNLVALPEVSDVACHPALRPVLVASLECLEQPPVSRGDARARLRHLVDHDAQRGLEQLQQLEGSSSCSSGSCASPSTGL